MCGGVFVVTKDKMTNKTKDAIQGWTFLSPSMIIIGIFVFASIAFALFLSFCKVNLFSNSYEFVGWTNYKRVFTDKQSIIAFKNTLTFSVVVVPIQTIIALLMATVLNSELKGRNQFRVIYFLPTLTSSSALTMIFMFLFSITGPINQLGVSLGLMNESINFLNDPKFALKVIMAMNIWSTVPFYMTIYLAGLQEIPKSTYEAAEVDGANSFQRLLYITIPQVKNVTTFVILMGIIGTLQMFDQAYIFSNGSGGPENSTLTVSLLIYRNAFGTTNTMGFAAALAIVLAALIFVLSTISKKLTKDGEV